MRDDVMKKFSSFAALPDILFLYIAGKK